MLRIFPRFLAIVALCAQFLPAVHAELLVRLDATTLPAGPLTTWQNTGSLGGAFTREINTPSVTTISGVKGVTLDGTDDWYVGPVAPASVTGSGSRTVIAWVYNPSTVEEETVFAWGRRDGPAGTCCSFNHGSNPIWGAVTHWDTPDVSWSGAQELGMWTCIAYTYDTATSIASVYTNGTLSTEKPIAALNTWATSTSGGGLPFVVGAQNLSNGSRSTAGSRTGAMTIARIMVHDRALSLSEITTQYNIDATAFGRNPVVSISSFSASTSNIFAGENSTLSWSIAGATSVSLSPAVTIAPGANSVTITPPVTTTYTLTASNGTSSVSKSLTVIVDPGTPIATGQSVVLPQDTPTSITLTATDPNPPPGGLSWQIVANPAHGVLSGTAPNLTYAPATGYAGTDLFTFRVSDGTNFSGIATVSIIVNPPPTNPTGVSLSADTITTSAVSGSFTGYLRAADPNFGETHTYLLVAGAGDTHNALFSIAGNQLIAQSNFAGQAGNLFSIRVRVTDSSGRSFEQIVQLTAADAPQSVVINEIFYDPPDNSRSEFVELHNPTASAIDLSGWSFTKGITYTFPHGTSIEAGGYKVVAMDPAVFLTQFGFAALGPFNGKLSGEGELVALSNSLGVETDRVEYRAAFPWPVSPTATGSSMELIHPSLDNDLGGSWRGSLSEASYPELTYVPAASTGWRWRPGITEASSPTSAWRANGFVEDGTWSTAVQAPIGFGTISSTSGALALNTNITGMLNNYRCIFARKTFTIAPGEIPSNLLLRYSQDDGILIWINGTLVDSKNVSVTEPTVSTAATNQSSEGIWYEKSITNAATFLVAGTNTIAVQVFNTSVSSGDLGFDIELKRTAGSQALQPTPGAQNTVFSHTAPPQIRQVDHSPKQPESTEAITVTTKVTDPQGISRVRLLYQIVAPGAFIPARFPRTVPEVMADPDGERPINPAFENPANWTAIDMFDDGSHGDTTAADGTFTAVIPAQAHRTLVRYRILATDIPGSSIRVPYADDESLNFAAFVYNGVPDFLAGSASVDPGGAGKVWPKSMLTALPVYHWIIRHEDMMTLQAYNTSEQFTNNGTDAELAARRAEEWEGAFVYDGVVYDHVCTRLRGGNSRYGDFDGRFPRGKRHYKFRFNDGNYLQAKDQNGKPYATKWKALALNRMFGTKGGNGWGMPEEIGATLWKTFGVPAQNTHWIHFRVLDDAAEAPDQYNGDFWGLTQAVEEYDGNYLDARGMTKGNLYKMSDWIWDADRQRRYQSPDMVRDGSEFNNIRDNLHGGQTAAWLNQYVNYEKWYRYSAIAEAIRHYDLFPFTDDIRHSLKNLAWYFEPVGPDPARGVCMFLPYDWDASFGPSFNDGWEHANNALYGWDPSTTNDMPYVDKPAMKIAHRNVLREFRDLIWQTDQINQLIDDRAAVIAEFSKADQDRWRNAPASAGTANDDTLAFKIQDMKNFCFTGWNGGSGPTVGAGGRAAYLDTLADAADAGLLPAQPIISYSGAADHPINGLAFQTSAFSDPQGAGTFGGMQWRIGRIEDPTAPAYDPTADFILEYTPVWESGTLASFNNNIAIPASAVKPGHTYRARVRMQDSTGRWSHWSAPYQFTATVPDQVADLRRNLMISEIMYHPHDSEDYEFIELLNISKSQTLDLTEVSFTAGIDFDFAASPVTSLAPGERVLVVKNLPAFESRYGSSLPVAGTWEATDNLSNSGERLTLSFGGAVIHDFIYDDAAPWPMAADGDGSSLMLIDPGSAPDHSVAANWQASDTPFGSPGNDDSRFAVWLSRRGATDPAAPAAPGMSHTLMYALGADLAANPANTLPTHGFTAGPDNKPRLTLSFRTRNDGTDVTYLVETSTNLTSWQSGNLVTELYGVPVDNGDGTQTEQVRVLTALDQNPYRFIRLKAVISR